MGLETGSTIASLIASNPTSGDSVSQGDDHIRLLKSVLQTQFPGSGGLGFSTPITATEAEINLLHGLTSLPFPIGTRLVFAQVTAPTGWTQDVSDIANNRMLRVINTTTGVAGSSIGGGTNDPTLNNLVTNHTHTYSGTVAGETQEHTHTVPDHTHSGLNHGGGGTGTLYYGGYTGIPDGPSSTGGSSLGAPQTGGRSAVHDHTYSGTSAGAAGAAGGTANWTPRYVNLILCTKS